MRFDWYTATTDEVRGPDLIDELYGIFSDMSYSGLHIESHRKVYRYDHAVAMKDDAGQLCIVRWGGNGGGTNIEANGPSAVPVSSFLRSEYPDHRVTRLDACVDREKPGLFDEFTHRLLAISDANRIAVDHTGDWHRAERGRTLYLGGRESEKRLRFYEKGHQLRAEGHPQASPHLCRLEAVIRPEQRDAKHRASKMSPEDCFGSSQWLREAIEGYAGLNAPEIRLKVHRKSQIEQAFEFMVKQYRRVLDHKLQQSGGDPMVFMDTFMAEFERQDKDKHLLRQLKQAA